MRNYSLKLSLFALVYLFAMPSSTPAQNIKAAMSGRVIDSLGNVISNAEVSIKDTERGTQRSIVTNSTGSFYQPGLEPGFYIIKVNKIGFAVYEVRNVELRLGNTVDLQIKLQPEKLQAQVDVTSDTVSTINLEDVKLSRNFNQEEMNDLPVQAGGTGRNFYAQAKTVPGVTLSTYAHAPFAVGGQRPVNNNYLIDSMDTNDAYSGRIAGRASTEQIISQEAISGFELITHNFKAEYGRNSGGIVSIVSKSGTNNYHGSIYEYHNNSALSARNFFEGVKPSKRSNLAGATLGGPLVKDRVHFFGQYEVFRIRGDASTLYQVPTDAQRATAVDIIKPLLNLYPIAAPGARQVTINTPNNTNQYTMLVRSDIVLNGKQNLMTRFNKTKSFREQYGSGNIVNSYTPGERITLSGTIQHNYAITPALFNEARIGYSRQVENDPDTQVTPLYIGNSQLNGQIALLRVTGLSTIGIPSYLNQYNFQNNYQFIDDATFSLNNHTLKFGSSVRRVQVNGGNIDNTFRGQLSFNSVADFLKNNAASYQINIGNPRIGLRRTEWQTYAQDDWKITPYLTLNLGARFEYNTAPRETYNRLAEKYLLNTDSNNIAPRIGFAYLPFKDNKTVIRGGYGIYYNVVELSFLGLTRFNPPFIQNFTTSKPAMPDLLAGARLNPSGLVIPDPKTSTPYAQHINFAIERELFNPKSSLSLAYVSTLGRKLSRGRRPNGGENFPSGTPRPDPSVGVVTRLETSASSTYHSLQMAWNQRLSSSLQIRAAYTWSKFIDDSSVIPTTNVGLDRSTIPLDEYNLRLERGLSDHDIPHILSFTYIWRVPFLRSNRFLGGWSVTGITTIQSGRTFSLYSGTNNLQGSQNNRIVDIDSTLIRDTSSKVGIRLADGVITKTIQSVNGTLGTLGRNTERTDGFSEWNLSLTKDFAVTENIKMQMRAEMFNIFNTTNFNSIDGVASSGLFGNYLSAFDPRRAQLALRVIF